MSEQIKKRVIFPIVGQGSIIHIIRSGILDNLRDSITPIIAMAWDEPELIKELKGNGYEVTFIPKYEVSIEYIQLRGKITLWYKKYILKSPTNTILKSYLDLYRKPNNVRKKKIKDTIQNIFFALVPGFAKSLIKKEALLIKQQPAFDIYTTWLNDIKADSIFTVTPFLPEIELIGRILKENGNKVIASIHSFDNITTRQWPAFKFDHYLVWNDFNKKELERIFPMLKNTLAITICGAPQFDFHFKKDFVWTREEWQEKIGLPKNKKVILYGGGPVALFKDEPQYLQHLNEAFKEGKLNSNDAVILFRSHPLDKKERWQEFVGNSSYIVYDAAQSGKIKFDYTNVNEEDIKRLMSTICHADVQINFTSTMTVDGSAFYKPQIGPYYTEIKKEAREELTRKMYYQEHYMHITNSKGINLASSKKEFINIVNDALYNPEKYIKHCNDCLHTLITYTDGKSAQRATNAIKTFFH